MKLRLFLCSIVLLNTIHPTPTRADWRLDGVPVSTAYSWQTANRIVSDGAGGAIVVWMDFRSLTNYDLYAQRIDASGAPMWLADGVAICVASGDQTSLKVIADGLGGAIISWNDYRSGTSDIYAQRINAAGAVQWTANGLAICTAANTQQSPSAVTDGAGGAIMTWNDIRSGVNNDVYAQRVNAAGAVQWTGNGVVISSAANDQYFPAIAADAAGGAIIAWSDTRSGTNDVYAQRVNAAGTVQWTANGIAICTATNSQSSEAIVPDGSGGAIVAWIDIRNGSNADIYAQRINAAGAAQWTLDGNAVCSAALDQSGQVLVSDGAGGAILSWYDLRSGTNYDVYAQRILANGSALWTYNGVAVSALSSAETNPSIVADGLGGAVVAWGDYRNGTGDVFAQELTALGDAKWGSSGVPVSTAAYDQGPPSVVLDAGTGAIVSWDDGRAGNFDIYAQRVELRYGYWGRPEPVLVTASDNPHDQGGKVELNWRPSGRDVLNQQTIYNYSIWRATDVAAVEALASAGAASLVEVPTSKSANAGARVVWRERTPATTYYWELVGSQVANYSDAYSFLASTRQDSVATNPATTYFRVVAESYNPLYNWPSNVLSAHSVDNLAPAAPLMLTAQRVGANVNLRWNRALAPDLRDYAVYRKTASGVTPVPINFLSSADDTVLTDASAPGTALYYIVTAYDVHANQSAPSNEASVQALTGIGNTPLITTLTVLQNQPNPFAGTTDLRVGLPANSDLSIEVFDVAGRRVRTQSLAHQTAGWRTIPFDGRDDGGHSLASGVYFYRVRAGGKTVTNKMVIAR